MTESPCPWCEKPVGHNEGVVHGVVTTLPPTGGQLSDRKVRDADCPHCGKPIMTQPDGEGGWQKDYGRAPRGE